MRKLFIGELIAMLIILIITLIVCLASESPDSRQTFAAATMTALVAFGAALLAIAKVPGAGVTALSTFVAVVLAILAGAGEITILIVVAIVSAVIAFWATLSGPVLLSFLIGAAVNFGILYYLPRLI